MELQTQHTRSTFLHDSTNGSIFTVVSEIPIDENLAEVMKTKIEQKISEGAKFLNPPGDLRFLIDILARQKGQDDNMFTCVGLIEWAARAGWL